MYKNIKIFLFDNRITNASEPKHRYIFYGRSVDVVFAGDGSLLVTDDGGDKIWRVTIDKK